MQRVSSFVWRFAGLITALSLCSTIVLAQDPGVAIPATTNLDDQKPGSVLVFNFFTSGSPSANSQNSRLTVTNTHGTEAIAVHMFLITGSTGDVDDFFLTNLGPNQTTSFLTSDFLPGVTGYAVAVAVDVDTGCPVSFNHLTGDADIKLSSGHHSGLGAVAISALYSGVVPGCSAMSTSAALDFDDDSYNRLPNLLALDNIASRADGNDTLLVLNQLSGDLGSMMPAIGAASGSLFDDATIESSFTFSAPPQLRQSLTNTFPGPTFETTIPAGRTGWLHVTQDDNAGWSGAAINFNPNASASAGAFNGGHNLHAETFSSTNTLTVPVSKPSTGVDVSVTKSHEGNLVPGTNTTYIIDVSNGILRATATAPIVVTDTLPGDLTLTGFSGAGWSCGTVGTANVSCTDNTDLPAGASAAPLSLFVDVGEGTPIGEDAVTNTATVSIAPQMEDDLTDNQSSETSTVVCPDCIPLPADTQMDDGKTGSVLVYNFFTSGASSGNAQNTRLSVTNTDAGANVTVRLFVIDGATGAATNLFASLGPNGTLSALASDIDPGVTGYAVAVAVDINTGCPVSFNHLAGDADIKLSSGHHTGLAAVGIAALYDGILPGCDAMSGTESLVFDDVRYNRLPGRIALDSIASRADGNDTLLVLNQLSGDLGSMLPAIGAASGSLFDDAAIEHGFTFSAPPQLRVSLTNAFPVTSPAFETAIPAGRSGWLHVTQDDNAGWSGAAINFNPNAAASAGAFNGGHNLHTETSSATNTLMVPVIPCDPPVVNPSTVPVVTIGVPYNQVFSTTGGAPPVVLELSGTLPMGLNFAGDTLSGTPTDAGTFAFTVTATDDLGCIGTREYMLVVEDNDGVPPSTENGAPNNGDGNGDGIPDRSQSNVASLPSATCDGYITVVASGSGGCGKLMDVTAVSEAAVFTDIEFDYPFGLVGFRLDCAASSMITVIFHCSVDANPSVYRKYGPEAPVFGDPHYYTLPGVVFGTTKVPPITGPDALTASFTLTNGLIGDGTPAADETIVDPGGPAVASPLPIPVASPAGVVALIALLMVLAVIYLRRQGDAA